MAKPGEKPYKLAGIERGYRGRNAPPDHTFKVYVSGQKRRLAAAIKRELRRRSAVEPCIGPSSPSAA